jgi:hypothetical protein
LYILFPILWIALLDRHTKSDGINRKVHTTADSVNLSAPPPAILYVIQAYIAAIPVGNGFVEDVGRRIVPLSGLLHQIKVVTIRS